MQSTGLLRQVCVALSVTTEFPLNADLGTRTALETHADLKTHADLGRQGHWLALS